MLFEDFQKITTEQSELSVEYKEQKVTFFVKPILARDKEILLKSLGDTLPSMIKTQKAIEAGDKFSCELTGQEFLDMQIGKKMYAQKVWCKKDGSLQYNSYHKMVESVESDLLDLIADEIENNKPEDLNRKEIEKNSSSPQD